MNNYVITSSDLVQFFKLLNTIRKMMNYRKKNYQLIGIYNYNSPINGERIDLLMTQIPFRFILIGSTF